ncbi:ABC transporter permease [Microbacterium atlanticum]|uniref:ABC transporter permease n=1 Tax=Microbacterium atlanticum TaxID=2782168 RepID=UPI001886C4DD|nr:ABC transporter permease [Microbacterium atlanticum]
MAPHTNHPVPAASSENADAEQAARSMRRTGVACAAVRAIGSTTAGRMGASLMSVVIVVALIGPLLAPHSVATIVGTPFQPPGAGALLGTDYLGRDVLSRFLHGGWLLILLALVAVTVAYAVAIPIALLAAYRNGRAFDHSARATSTVLNAIPAIVLALIVIAAFGRGPIVILLAVAIIQLPAVVQIFRGAALGLVRTEYVDAARARGESTSSILLREIAPNIRGLIAADVGLRFGWAIMLMAAISFLGFGQAPPAADWGLMISENRMGITTQPLPVIVCAAAIACLTIGLTLVADAVARSVGRS